MRFVRSLATAALLAVLCSAPLASAQTNPIVQHYRAYVAAMERGDLTAATAEAEAALAASEARDGDGGRTSVLSFNAANVHLLAGRHELARPFAARALTLARGGAAGVDPVAAEVAFLRASLPTSANTSIADQLNTLLHSPGAQSLDDESIYAAATEFGNWGLSHQSYALAQAGWELAGAHPAGSPFGETFGLGRARTSEGIAIVMAELDEARGRRIDEDQGLEAYALLSEGARLLDGLSRVESPSLELTVAQQTYAQARAWMLALDAKLRSDGYDVPEAPEEAQGDADGLSEIGVPVDLTRPRCMMRVVANPLPRYPTNSQVAAVVMFFRVGPNGEIVSHQVAARAGSEQFAEAIERVVGRWHLERMAESPENCRMESNVLQTIRFVMP